MARECEVRRIYQIILTRAHWEGIMIIDKDEAGEFFLYPDGSKKYLPKKKYSFADWAGLSAAERAALNNRVAYWVLAERLAAERDGIYLINEEHIKSPGSLLML